MPWAKFFLEFILLLGDFLGKILFTLGEFFSKSIYYWANFFRDLGEFFFKPSGHTGGKVNSQQQQQHWILLGGFSPAEPKLVTSATSFIKNLKL